MSTDQGQSHPAAASPPPRATAVLWQSLRTLLTTPPFLPLAASTAASLLLLYLLVFLQSTTFVLFFTASTISYVMASVALTILIALLGGLAAAQTVYILSAAQPLRRGQGLARQAFSVALGMLSVGCPACASPLLPALGIAGSLAAFPLGGLEIKLLALAMLADVIWEGARVMGGVSPPIRSRLVDLGERSLSINLNGEALRRLKPAALIGMAALAVTLLPAVPAAYRADFATGYAPPGADAAQGQGLDTLPLLEQINPPEGYALPYTYGDIGPQLIAAGAIDVEKFAQVYADAGNPLTGEQWQILTEGSDARITISRESAHFLLNLFWALGLANQNPILDEGPLTQVGREQVTQFASTGGWTLAAKPVAEVYSSAPIIALTEEQQQRVEEAAVNTYRPCCNNSTAFADCNHGMAMLGLFQLMAAHGAKLDEMFEAARYFNAFWFPQQTLDLAVYFQAADGQSFAEVDARTLVGPEYSSGQGWSTVRRWLEENGRIEQAPGGGGCSP